ncbi:MAG: tRNA (adenosine(37)-N6)-threonylcarbamoyltransferase complex dimerization subunit type 1 TsaB [Acidobacteriota bacterium]|nr:tRNA (adenosine(37)-N6)-threonylcarbamoyltransferase complex dimerization subunit type 1 TsaB [Acidobacteriota bacterium]
MILSLDTTCESGSLALVEAGRVIAEHAMHSPDGFGHVLYGELESFLARHNVRLHQIECFAGASGPGSFTGVRVGLAAIKGLAEATCRPAVGVSNLQAIAYFGTAPLRAAVIDARRGEVYAAVYNSDLKIVRNETVSDFAHWRATLLLPEVEFVTAPLALAVAVGQIAWRRMQAGQAHDPAALDANYVRRSDAELLWKPPK